MFLFSCILRHSDFILSSLSSDEGWVKAAVVSMHFAWSWDETRTQAGMDGPRSTYEFPSVFPFGLVDLPEFWLSIVHPYRTELLPNCAKLARPAKLHQIEHVTEQGLPSLCWRLGAWSCKRRPRGVRSQLPEPPPELQMKNERKVGSSKEKNRDCRDLKIGKVKEIEWRFQNEKCRRSRNFDNKARRK